MTGAQDGVGRRLGAASLGRPSLRFTGGSGSGIYETCLAVSLMRPPRDPEPFRSGSVLSP